MVSQDLMDLIRMGFALSLDGIHGEAHWRRVRDNGLRLAEQNGADPEIVALFAYLHDSQRHADGWDRGHGQRAAEFVRELSKALLPLPEEQLDLLSFAIARHSDGLTEADITIQACWDADRLDLGRIGIRPEPRYLCTEAARSPLMIEWAYRNSLRQPAPGPLAGHEPGEVSKDEQRSRTG